MTRIKVTPENLLSLSTSMANKSAVLQSLDAQLQNILNGLDWETRQKIGMEEKVNQARGLARVLSSQTEQLSKYLQNKGQAFLTADQACANDISGISRQFSDWQRFYKGSASTLDHIRNESWFEHEQRLGWHDRFKDLDELKKQLENEDGSFQDPLRRIFYLESKIGYLQRERDNLAKQAGSLVNIFKRDELNAEIAKLDAEIARLGQIKDDYGKYYLLNDLINNGTTYSPLQGEAVPAYDKTIKYLRDDGAGLDSNCTWYGAAAVKARTGQQLPKWGDAGQWTAKATNYAKDNPGGLVSGVDAIPEAGSVLCDKDSGPVGHVMYVESVHLSSDGKKWEVTVSEENYYGGSIGTGKRISLTDPSGGDVGRWRRTISLDIDPGSNPPAVKDSSLQFIHINTSVIDSPPLPISTAYA